MYGYGVYVGLAVIVLGQAVMESQAKGDKAQKPAGSTSYAERLAGLDAVMDRYLRDGAVDQVTASLSAAIAEYNAWVDAAVERHKTGGAELEKQIAQLHAFESQIKALDTRLTVKPELDDGPAVEQYNTLVVQRNDLVKKYNEQAKLCRDLKEAFEADTQRSEKKMQARRGQVTAREAAVEKHLADYKQWVASGEDLGFFRQVNRLFADLHCEKATAESPELAAMIDRVRAIRGELAEEAVRRHRQGRGGLMVVEATVCRREKCLLVVDTGATDVTLSPALVDALGLSDRLGETIEGIVADGRKITGRKLVLPQLAVQGLEAEDVKAVALDEPELGVDGLLGLSYLGRFSFRLDPQHPNRMILEKRSDK